jgi:hypothetical protein
MTATETQQAQQAEAGASDKTLTNADAKATPIVVRDEGEFALLMDSGRFGQLWRVANMYASSSMVPDHYRGKPGNCAIAVQMAIRMNVDPFMFMQKTYCIQGKPGMEAQLAIALVNTRGPFTGPIQWRFSGDGKTRSCTAFATHKQTGEICEATVDWAMAEAEGWSRKNGSKWLTMPRQMFMYRSAAFLARLYCPEVLMGMATVEELEDIPKHVETTVISSETPGQTRTEKLAAILGQPEAADAQAPLEEAATEPAELFPEGAVEPTHESVPSDK